jgi:hypothetical protein
MTTAKIAILAINIAGGAAVIGSYVVGLAQHPGGAERLWGGVPVALRGVYGASMLLAAAGYLLFFHHIVVRMDPAKAALPWGLPYGFFAVPFVMILLPSSFWMSLTFAYAAAPSTGLWIALRLVLGLVALGSAMMFAMLVVSKGPSPDQFSWPAAIGAAVFTFHTLVLDGLLWPALFRA